MRDLLYSRTYSSVPSGGLLRLWHDDLWSGYTCQDTASKRQVERVLWADCPQALSSRLALDLTACKGVVDALNTEPPSNTPDFYDSYPHDRTVVEASPHSPHDRLIVRQQGG
jgi:hypothetical protein